MKSSYLQICTLLAASAFREREITEFSQAIHQLGPKAFMDDVMSMRRAMSSLQGDVPYDVPSRAPVEASSEIVARIERLLVDETGLPKAAAIDILSSELRMRFPNQIIPSESRRGFQVWIHRLTNIISEKELLHLATAIRNRYVHERPSDWRLK